MTSNFLLNKRGWGGGLHFLMFGLRFACGYFSLKVFEQFFLFLDAVMRYVFVVCSCAFFS